MTQIQRRLTVGGRGPDARATFSVHACTGKVWITLFDCPFRSEAILETTQADTLVDLISQAAQQARSHKTSPPS